MERLKLNIQRFATSGSLTTPANTDGTTFTFAWSRQSYSIADNKSTIYWEVRINAAYTYQSNAVKLGATTIDGSQVHGGGTWSNISKGTTTLISGTKDIYHNPNGTKSFAVSISGWTWESTWTSADNSSNPFVLDTIPRYTTVSTWSVASKTETSITLNWKTADTCSQIRYGTSTSSYTTANVNSNSGTVTISGLTAGQTYTLYFMPKRKDSSLWGDGSDSTWKNLANQATYRYPYCSSTSKNFTIGQSVTISIYNPLKRDVKIQMWSHTSQGFVSDLIDVNTGNKDSYTGFNDVTTRLYQSIPNAKSSAYNIDVWTGNHKEVNTVGNYSVDETANKPVFNDFTYADINSITTALTGDDQKVIQGYSNIQATISVANKATAQNYATMDRYDLIIQGNATQSASYSDSEDVTIVVNNANSGSIKVNAVDSRNIPKEVPKTATLIPYTNIQRGNISVTRAGNVGEATTLVFNGTLWEGDFGAVTNTITSVQYRFKSTASGSQWSAYASLTPPTPSGNSYSFSGLIAGDEGNTGFSVDNSFNIEVVVSDRLSSITFTAILGTGIPHIAVADDGIAIKQPYDTNDSSVLQVNGNESVTGAINATSNINSNGFLLEKNAQVTPIDITDYSGTLLSKVKALGTNGTYKAIWFSRTDGGTANISDKPTGSNNAGFVCIATCNRWASNSDYRYYVECYVQADRTGYYGIVENGTSSITWLRQYAQKLEAIRTRPTTANITHSYENSRAHLEMFLSTSGMTTAKPNSDGYILHCSWDNDGKYDSQLYLPNNNDNHQVQFRGCNNGTWGSWENIYRAKSLYDNSSGVTGNVTLSESSANFSILQIFYYINSSGNSNYGSTFVYSPNGKRVGLVMTHSTTSALVLGSCIKTISGTNITNVINGTHNSFGGPAAYNEIFVYKVLGYR